jgi:hypothetical protein
MPGRDCLASGFYEETQCQYYNQELHFAIVHKMATECQDILAPCSTIARRCCVCTAPVVTGNGYTGWEH